MSAERIALAKALLEAPKNGASAELPSLIVKNRFDINRLPEPDAGIIYVNGELVGSKGNVVAITGKAKSRKSVVAGAMLSSMVGGIDYLGIHSELKPDDIIIHLDTEQGYSDYYASVLRILDNGGLDHVPDRFISIHERGFTAAQRLESLELLFKEHSPTVCVIDGIRDMLMDFNSNEETDKVISTLLRLSLEYNALIICIIHVTKGHGFMRGALGTALEDKSETVAKVEKDENEPNRSTIEPQYSRHKDFNQFAIIWSDEVMGYVIDGSVCEPVKTGRPKKLSFEDLTDEEHKQVLNGVFGVNAELPYKALIEGIKLGYKLGTNKAKDYQAKLVHLGYVLKAPRNNAYYRSTKLV